MAFTRRTHIVRIKNAKNPEVFLDMEVLDAIGFITTDGREMVLSVDATAANPFIVDDTGSGQEKTPSAPVATRRSHMEKIESTSDPTQFFYMEILDAAAFRDENNKEWILVMPDEGSVSSYNTTTQSGDKTSTRRVHDEKIYSDPKDKTSTFILVERCDMMCFRSTNDEEMIIEMPSSDDENDPSAVRAATYSLPLDYIPGGDVAPPDNTDPGVYAFIPDGSKGVATGTDKDPKTKVRCPLWWPRSLNKKSGPWYWYLPTQTASGFSLYATPGKYEWTGNPSSSSWAGTLATEAWEYLQGILFQSLDLSQTYFIPFQPFGWASLDDAIKGGIPRLDWGYLDLSDTRIDDTQKDGLNKTPCVPGVSGDPDIWQLTKIKAPDLIKPIPPAVKWLPGPIPTALYKKVAIATAKVWNDTSINFNMSMAACAVELPTAFWYHTWPFPVDEGMTQRFGMGHYAVSASFPTTSFGVPLWDEHDLYNPLMGGRFVGGLPYPYYNYGNSDTFTWAGTTVPIDPPGDITGLSGGSYAIMIATTQLDPKKWDTTDPQNPKPKAPKP